MYSKIIVISGAGLSADSGIATFRDDDGTWKKFDVEKLGTLAAWYSNRTEMEVWYNQRRKELEHFQPNAAHLALAQLQTTLGKERVRLFTQNGDNMLEKAGAQEVFHVHGNMTELLCLDCHQTWDCDYAPTSQQTRCPHCQSLNIKPGVILFGEDAPLYAQMDREIKDTKDGLILVIGTLGTVLPFSRLVGNRHHPRRPRTILNNLHREADVSYAKYFDQTLFGAAKDVVPPLVQQILSPC